MSITNPNACQTLPLNEIEQDGLPNLWVQIYYIGIWYEHNRQMRMMRSQ